jgi:4-hydroxyphenylpyruvate dioxygenase-like putative hemolysin
MGGLNINIKPENRGKFTASAEKHGKSVQAYAHQVVGNPNTSETQRKRAQFAINARKWKHGGNKNG